MEEMYLTFYFVDHQASATCSSRGWSVYPHLSCQLECSLGLCSHSWHMDNKNLHESVTIGHSYTLGCRVCRVLMLGTAYCSIFPDLGQQTKVKVTNSLISSRMLQGLVFLTAMTTDSP